MAAIDRLNSLASETTLAIKAPCLVATTGANITLSGIQTIDGVTVGNNSERVLVKDQTDTTQNNIYIASSGNWTLAQDAGGNTDWTNGTIVLVAEGAVNALITFTQTCTDSPIVVGTSHIAFTGVRAINSLPDNTTMLGRLLATAVAAPGTPAAGIGAVYLDSTQKVLSLKNDAGTVSITVVPAGATSHQWVTSITSAGVLVKSQPAFSDISGSVAASQLPNPGASTLGGVKSLASVSHQFLTQIGTDGTPAQAQPAFSDISGAAAIAQMPTDAILASITFVISGGGSTIVTGMKGYLEIPFPCTINRSTLLADESGSIVVNIWKCTYAQFDAGNTHPVVGDKITASAPPTISSGTSAQDSTLTGWTTTINAGDILAFNVDSVTSVKQATLSLKVTKT